jgi:PAS domain-containing protein
MIYTLAFLIVVLIIMLATIIKLSRAHNHLQQNLNKSYAEIEKTRKEVQAQVSERTAAIRKVNEDLQYEIRERMKSEKGLLEQVQLLQSVVCSAPVVLWAMDSTGVLRLAEGKGLTALGLNQGEVVGKSVFDVYKDNPQILQNCQRALAGESFKACIESFGRVYECWYSPVRDADGKVVRAIGLALDRDGETEIKK